MALRSRLLRLLGSPSSQDGGVRSSADRSEVGALLALRERELEVRREEAARQRIGLALTGAVAVLAHVGLLLPLFAVWLESEPGEPPERDVKVMQLSSTAWEKNRQLKDRPDYEPPPPAPKEEPPKEEPEEEMAPGQVVRLPPPVRQERPEQADYASEYDQKTDRETRARQTSRMAKNVTRKPQVGVEKQKEQPEGEQQQEAKLLDQQGVPGGPAGPGRATEGETGTDRENGGGSPAFAFEVPEREKRSGLELEEEDDGSFINREALEELRSKSDRYRLSLGRTSKEQGEQAGDGRGDASGQGMRGGAGGPGLPNLAQLTPTLSELEQVTGAPANDWLPEVETDAETRLNAWRWKHATFFNRIADGIRRAWEGPELLQKEDPTGSVYGTQELLTILAVTIDRDGNIVDIAVREASGAPFLDDEAIRTFRTTGPFSNPPAGLFEGGERFTFTFGFNVSYTKTEIDLNWRPY